MGAATVLRRRERRTSKYYFLGYLFAYLAALVLYRLAWVNDNYNATMDYPGAPEHRDAARLIVPQEDRVLQLKGLQEVPIPPYSQEIVYDFAVVGLDKTYTHVLTEWLGEHPQISMLSDSAGPWSYAHEQGKREIRGINLHWEDEWEILQQSWKTKLIVVLRHPVGWFEDLINHQRHISNELEQHPSAFIGTCRRQGQTICTDTADVAFRLMKLGKSLPISKHHLPVNDLRVHPNPVFLVTWEQLTTTNVQERQRLLTDMTNFLGVGSPSINYHLTFQERLLRKNSHPYSHATKIYICDASFGNVRKELLRLGAQSARWIREDFLTTSTVTCSQTDWLEQNLETWTVDPCRG